MEVLEEFMSVHPDDLWVYNKLQLSRKLGYNCGPIGAPVPHPGWYIIRPAINFLGMGRRARKIWLAPTDKTEMFGNPSEFWCDYFTGEHVSVDYENGEQILTVQGIKAPSRHGSEESRWNSWRKIERDFPIPEFLEPFRKKYSTINVEYIGFRLIEVHFRKNPDFRWGNDVAIPVYDDMETFAPPDYRYVESPDYQRTGFFIK